MNTLNTILRSAFLVLFLVGIVVAVWHISWLHKQSEARYEIRTPGPVVFILDKQERVVYAAAGILGDQPVVWHKSPLPQ